MNIEKQFNLVAEEYDTNRRKFIPCFDDFYRSTTKFIASNITEPKRVLDLGAGTGLLSYFLFQHYPKTEYVLVDIADDMLNIARSRFANIENVNYKSMNYVDKLPDGNFDMIVSALSIHHLEHDDKYDLFKRIYDILPSEGLFINYDQFCAGQPEMNIWFDHHWETQLASSGLTEHDIELWKERRKLDKECSVEQETEMLYRCGFKVVKCVYSYQKFAVVLAIK